MVRGWPNLSSPLCMSEVAREWSSLLSSYKLCSLNYGLQGYPIRQIWKDLFLLFAICVILGPPGDEFRWKWQNCAVILLCFSFFPYLILFSLFTSCFCDFFGLNLNFTVIMVVAVKMEFFKIKRKHEHWHETWTVWTLVMNWDREELLWAMILKVIPCLILK